MTTLMKIRELLEKSINPLYFYDDDPDGVISYLLLKRKFGKGNGVIIRVRGLHLDEEELYLKKINEFNPDLVVFLDKPTLNQNVFDKIDVGKIWIDHHEIVKVKGVHYYNPRIRNKKDNRPTSYICYKIVKQDMWLAAIGVASDWSLALFSEFKKKYPEFLGDVSLLRNVKPDDVLYKTKLGELARIISFALKGKTLDVRKNIDTLYKIGDPYEILEKKTDSGRKLSESAEKFKKKYSDLLKNAVDENRRSKRLIIFRYVADDVSFTADLANELLHRFPGKIIAVCRIKDEQTRISLRSSVGDVELPRIIDKICNEIKCSGGGHEHAAAMEIHKDDFDKFIKLLRKHVG